jgi:isopentenyl diphosphate isomerase/L-lactate dehydrogenase-like FMN-dependent dehydrogenase
LPKPLYIAVSERGYTYAANIQAYDQVDLRPRAATAIIDRDVSTTVLGQKISCPILTAPTGLCRLLHPAGEIAVARAASAEGTIAIISMHAGHTIEEITSASSGPVWQQLYMDRGREHAEGVIDRATRSGCTALVLTLDIPFNVVRAPNSYRNRATSNHPIRIDFWNAVRFGPDIAVRPRWLLRLLRSDVDLDIAASIPSGLTTPVCPTWADFEWIRKQWSGPIVAKGIVTADDGRRAVTEGASAVVVSNHGAMGLDGIRPTLRALPEVVEAVNGEAEVLLDGGIRRGSDVVKALGLGARAVLIGRPYLWGLSVGGEAGVRRVIDVLRRETDILFAMLGCATVADVDRSLLDLPDGRRWVGIEPGVDPLRRDGSSKSRQS